MRTCNIPRPVRTKMEILVYLATERSIIEFRKGFSNAEFNAGRDRLIKKYRFLSITGSVCNGTLSYLAGILLVICDLLTKLVRGQNPRRTISLPDIIPTRTLSPLLAKCCAKIFMDPDIASYHDARCIM